MEDLFQRLKTMSVADSPLTTTASMSAPPDELAAPSKTTSPYRVPRPQTNLTTSTLSPVDPVTTAAQSQSGGSPSVRNSDLLSLLKFRQSASTCHSGAPDASSADDHSNGLAQSHSSPPAHPISASQPDLQDGPFATTNPQSFLLKLLNQTPKGKAAPTKNIQPIIHDLFTPSATAARLHMSPGVNATLDVAPVRATSDLHHESVSDAVTGVEAEVKKQLALALATATPNKSAAPSSHDHTADRQSSDVAEPNAAGRLSGIDNGSVAADNPTAKDPNIGNGAKADSQIQQTSGDASWLENFEGSATTFTLPMQPFKAIRIGQLGRHPPLIPTIMTMDIARVRRPFDQIDRNLVTATPNLMVYPLKNGGLRTIQQETGAHKEVFKQFPERIFNVVASTRKSSNGQNTELILGTGVEGSVFWAPLAAFAASDDVNVRLNDDLQSFMFPPVALRDEVMSGGQLKSRVKPSSCHPEFFAYSRGKAIYIIYPRIASSQAYLDPVTQVCKSEKYLKEHMLRVSTGKAGKDFIFSADDSLIISLDKAGRLKFWDIRHLTQERHTKCFTAEAPLEITVPVMTLATCPNTGKSWPTSVHLVDKEKPTTKGIALRYLIVGMEQNHTLQLWDLTLGKPVQEINFPHEQDTDAICSIVFHAKTGIITVAHPTRNSIYFLHLSIPPYSIPSMNQAKFVALVAEKHSSLPPPQSTIIVNGIREFKFHQQAILRSIDILAESESQYGEDPLAFVLYAMHSNGITEIKVSRDMLGLGENNRLLNGTSALEHKDTIHVENMKALPSAVAGDAISMTSEAASVIPGSSFDESLESTRRTKTLQHRAQGQRDGELVSNVEISEKGNKKGRKALHDSRFTSADPPATIMPHPNKSFAEVKDMNHEHVHHVEDGTSGGRSMLSSTISEASRHASESTTTAPQSITSTELAQIEALLEARFGLLQENLSQDRLSQDALASVRQEAILKTVSRTLAENVEDSLSRIVTDGLAKITAGSLKTVVASVLQRQLTSSLQEAMRDWIPHELNRVLPAAFNSAMKDMSVAEVLSEQVSSKITEQTDARFEAVVQTTLTPELKTLLDTTLKQLLSELGRSSVNQLRNTDAQLRKHLAKFDALRDSITRLEAAVTDLTVSQQKQHAEILSILHQHRTTSYGFPPVVTSANAFLEVKQNLSPVQLERVQIQDALGRKQHEEATLKWMHSNHKAELFDLIFVHHDPRYLETLSPLLILSVAATVSEELASCLRERLYWIDVCLTAVNQGDSTEELQDVLPNVLDVILQRIQQSYMQVSERSFQDPVLRRMHQLAQNIGDIKAQNIARKKWVS